MANVSALLMVYNEQDQIRDCLETVKWADEIVVCDSFSTDRTVEICREYTHQIYQRRFDDFGSQKKWTLDKPSCEWVLFVEADERISPELAREIRRRLAADEGFDGYWMPFENYFLGSRLRGRFWTFEKIKLYRRGKGGWQDRLVHSGFLLDGRAGHLTHPVRHYPYRTLRIFRAKFERAAAFEAKELLRRRAPAGWRRTVRATAWVPLRFLVMFFYWQEYKSGLAGLVFSLLDCPYSLAAHLKYRRLLKERG